MQLPSYYGYDPYYASQTGQQIDPYKTFRGVDDTIAAPTNPDAYTAPAAPAASSLGKYLNAGVGAASTAAQLISQAVAANAQREAQAQQNQLTRDTDAKIAAQRIAESKYEADTSAHQNAYKMLLSALSNNMGNLNGSFENKRAANQGVDQILASAMLK